jgi:hypothetical protein
LTSPAGHQATPRPEPYRSLTHPEGYPSQDAVELAASQRQEYSSGTRRRPTSMSFVIALSIILGCIIASGTILGVVGKAFYVSRDEYTQKNLSDAENAIVIKASVERFEHVLSRMDGIIDKLSESVQAIKLDMARKR